MTGVDVSLNMLEKARKSFPHISFFDVNFLSSEATFDLVFSSFVLFEISNTDKIIQYLVRAFSFLKKDGIFIGITGSEDLYSPSRNWMTFDVDFPENNNLKSGDAAKLLLKKPKIEFYDYYWKNSDYVHCFKESGLEIIQTYHPLGSNQDPYSWKDELSYSPFTVFIARKPNV